MRKVQNADNLSEDTVKSNKRDVEYDVMVQGKVLLFEELVKLVLYWRKLKMLQ